MKITHIKKTLTASGQLQEYLCVLRNKLTEGRETKILRIRKCLKHLAQHLTEIAFVANFGCKDFVKNCPT
jgi:hypothetical protein